MGRPKPHRRPWTQLLVAAAITFALIYVLWAVKTLKKPSSVSDAPSTQPQVIRVVTSPATENTVTDAAAAASGEQLRSKKITVGDATYPPPASPLLANPPSSPMPPSPSPSPPLPPPVSPSPAVPQPPPPSPPPNPLPVAPSPSPVQLPTSEVKPEVTAQSQEVHPSGTGKPGDLVAFTDWQNSSMQRMGRSSGSQGVHVVDGGATLFSWGLKEARLGRDEGDSSIPEPAMPDLKVTSVAASRHSAIATSEGHVWTMGHNDSKGGGGGGSPPLKASGQLGRPGGVKAARVMAMEGQCASSGEAGSQGQFVIQVVTGRYHTLAVTPSGFIWSWGLGVDDGQSVIQVVTGRYHTLAVTATGSVYSWGLNDWGQLGRSAVGASGEDDPSACFSGPSCHDGAPQRVRQLEGINIIGAASGRYNTMAVDDAGNLYVWGYDGCGSNGDLPNQTSAWKARRVKGDLEGKQVVAFDAGYTFWIAATKDGGVYTCNHQDDGYAGTLERKREPNENAELGREGNPLVPMQVTALAGRHVTAVAAGREHALAVTDDGRVYSWGGRGEVSGRGKSNAAPGVLEGHLANDTILFVAAGEYHSLAASQYYVYGWGGNDYLAVGVGRNNSEMQRIMPGRDRGTVPIPARVAGPLGQGSWKILGIAAGFQHSMAIAQKDGRQLDIAAGVKVPEATPKAESTEAKAQPTDAKAEPTEAKVESTETKGQSTEPKADSAVSSTGSATSGAQPTGNETSSKEATTTAASGSETGGKVVEAAEAGQQPQNVTDGMDHSAYAYAQVKPQALTAAQIWANFTPSPHHEELVKASPDVFEGLPEFFSSRTKNPCWFQDRKLRCIPYYHILGVSKCGTTDIYNRLIKHPHIYESLNKGPHWWDECPWPLKGACTAPPKGDFQGYIDLFAKAAESIAKDPLGITGEASSNTFTSAMGVYLRGPTMTKDINVTMPQLLREASPFLRLIVIFRNPADRYYSAFYYYRWWKKDEPTPGPEDFHRTAVQDINDWNACVRDKGQTKCLRLYNPQQLVKGMYSEFLGDWLRAFPRESFLFLRNEDYKVAQREHMDAVFKFLGVRDLTDKEWEEVMGMPIKNVGKNNGTMLPETRKLLDDFYAPFNKKLAEQLADNRYLWTQ